MTLAKFAFDFSGVGSIAGSNGREMTSLAAGTGAGAGTMAGMGTIDGTVGVDTAAGTLTNDGSGDLASTRYGTITVCSITIKLQSKMIEQSQLNYIFMNQSRRSSVEVTSLGTSTRLLYSELG